ncbi:MAG: methylenetetrahydrofolate reductase [NAD(P)H] [Deltaproteobacteria bacterium]|nr:methylenetetrahydrofolate reductase [NAD(P)H] [Deltaproteobacteria bacterium]
MKISELFKNNKVLLSFEFFPPKSPESEDILDETVSVLKRFHPDFVSVTYGAGGSTRVQSVDWTFRIKEKHDLNVMMHLTCIASSKRDLKDITAKLKRKKIENVLALRGDPPKDFPRSEMKDDFQYAYQLVEYLHVADEFSIGVAGYPEGHMEAPSIEKDMEYLKMKVDAGADFIITQLFFDNNYFYDFMERAHRERITVPIIPGLMPIVNINQVKKFTDMCGATVPNDIMEVMRDRGDDDMLKIGVEYAVAQCRELLAFGVAGLHFYTLNRNKATEQILTEIEGRLRD